MTPLRSFGEPEITFLVERYLPASAVGGLAESVARVARVCGRTGHGGVEVRYLQSTYVPADDTCFCVFQGPSSDAVREVNEQAHFALDRITDAVALFVGADPTMQGDVT